MVVPYATQQLVRVVTDRVLEQVTKQLAKQQSIAPPPQQVENVPPDFMTVVGALEANIDKLRSEVERFEKKVDQVDARMTRLQKRWNWQMTLRITVGVVLAFVAGFALAYLLHLGGWY